MSFREEVHNWLKRSLEDPLVLKLAENSNLTITQLETLLIDVLAENLAPNKLKYEEKANLRRNKAPISRGSFNRTLRQAKTNIIRSIYTLLLLGYFGILENPNLAPYNEAANKLREYTQIYKDLFNNRQSTKEKKQILSLLREELESVLTQLSKPWITDS
ncbi:MAG: hypothetical protein JSV64_03280 [Candidatus Bathyarchaeota archaeon]|nr:MAG: hypothetical protein JSV64_03280 [Candidatus Bathyarchaeota archaeon]